MNHLAVRELASAIYARSIDPALVPYDEETQHLHATELAIEAIRYAEESLGKGYALDELKRNFGMQGVVNDPNFHWIGKK